MQLLKELCAVHGPSGNEGEIKDFILKYIKKNKSKWSSSPQIIDGDNWQDCLLLKFGKPKTAILTHIDTTGFTVRYQDQLVPIGGPVVRSGYRLKGRDSLGEIECELKVHKNKTLSYDFPRAIDRGTDLTFKTDFLETKSYVQSCYMDNRLGNYAALKVAETLKNGVIAFTTWEEHGGGSVPYVVRHLWEEYNIRQILICDITWVTDGVSHGNGVAISMRDRNIPRRQFIDRVIGLAEESGIDFQLEIEGDGSSDGREVQLSPYPIDWCFIGAPEDNVHSPNEKVHKRDIQSMIDLYAFLMKKL